MSCYSRLAGLAGQRLGELGYNNIDIHVGTAARLARPGELRPHHVTAAVPKLPNVLCTQLAYHDGRMILPVGDQQLQELKLITRQGEGISTRTLLRCRSYR